MQATYDLPRKAPEFPRRVWTKGVNGLWSSHEPTREDLQRRADLRDAARCTPILDYQAASDLRLELAEQRGDEFASAELERRAV